MCRSNRPGEAHDPHHTSRAKTYLKLLALVQMIVNRVMCENCSIAKEWVLGNDVKGMSRLLDMEDCCMMFCAYSYLDNVACVGLRSAS